MEKISEGPDLDRAVAEAIGLVCMARVLGGDLQFFVDPRDPMPGLITFQPSIDMNDAFHAAKEASLFNVSHRVLRKDILDGTWEVVDILASSEVMLASEDTPALAICAAIINRKQSCESK